VPYEVQAAARRRVVSLAAGAAPIEPPRAPVAAPPRPHQSVGEPDRPTAEPDHGRHRGPAPPALSAVLAGIEDRLPPTLRAGRVGLDLRAAVALGLVGLVAVAFGGSYLWRARPEAAPPQRAVLVATPTPAVTYVVVDVEGTVPRPGVVRLASGARVVDALHAAGGARPGADTTALNLARLLVDGEQILVGQPGQPAAGQQPSGAGAAGGLLDLNTATLEQLDELPGVGPVLAQRILDWRAEHGRFSSVDELQEVPGIGPAKFAGLAKKVRV